jgi:hypothetical protein
MAWWIIPFVVGMLIGGTLGGLTMAFVAGAKHGNGP